MGLSLSFQPRWTQGNALWRPLVLTMVETGRSPTELLGMDGDGMDGDGGVGRTWERVETLQRWLKGTQFLRQESGIRPVSMIPVMGLCPSPSIILSDVSCVGTLASLVAG